jgi:hypothetical protein
MSGNDFFDPKGPNDPIQVRIVANILALILIYAVLSAPATNYR